MTDSSAAAHAATATTTLLLGVVVYLLVNLFTPRGTPLLLGGDQVFFWMNAQRMLHGELIYRDFLEVTPPGTDLLYLWAFNWFGPRIWIPNLMVLGLGTALCGLCFHIAASLLRRSQAVLASALFMVLFYGRMLNATHHWFSMLAVLSAVAVLLPASTPRRIATAAALLGVASFFTQTRGLFAAIAVAAYLLWERDSDAASCRSRLRRQLLLWLPLLATWMALSGYFIARVGFGTLWYFQVSYVRRYMMGGWNPLSFGVPQVAAALQQPGGKLAALVYLALPLVYAISLWKCCRRGQESGSRAAASVALLAGLGVAVFVEIAQSPSSLRLYCVSMPGVILALWLLARMPGRWPAYAMRLLWIGLIAAAAYQIAARQLRPLAVAPLPGGAVAGAPLAVEKLTWFARHTAPGQFVFQAAWPGIYLPLALRNPVFLDNLDTGHAIRPDYVELSARQLQAQQVQYVLWSPALESPLYPFGEFRRLLGDRYRRIWTFSDQDQIWQLR